MLVEITGPGLTAVPLLLGVVHILFVTARLDWVGVLLLVHGVVLAANHLDMLFDWRVDVRVDFSEHLGAVVFLSDILRQLFDPGVDSERFGEAIVGKSFFVLLDGAINVID